MRSKKLNIVISVIPFLLIVVIWSLIPLTKWSNPFILPDLTSILTHLGDAIRTKTFWLDIESSLVRVLTAFLLSAAIAIPFGLLASFSLTFSRVVEPLSEFIRYLPVPAFVPLFIMWFGLNDWFMIATIFTGTAFQLILMVSDIGREVDPDYYASDNTLGAKLRQIYNKILWPAALPQVVNACRIAIGWAWTYLIVAEIANSGNEAHGLGFRILESMRVAQTYKIFSGIMVIGLIGILTDQVFRLIHRLSFRWIQ